MAYQEFLRANGINPEDLSQKEYSDLLNTQDMYNDDLIHFSKSENCKDVCPHFSHITVRLIIPQRFVKLVAIRNSYKEFLVNDFHPYVAEHLLPS